ncbi:MAG: polyhydroxyalkanoate synthesis repressor PhaR [Sphingomonadaceae bacterium]|uniref:polyhydroxyalkanoate synthesis repressor PhaR n=1 Tax=Thermaurantiacus sp. TaxID=2820283 RepID=UPI00298F01A2|nr:polyhydroxyalkanoate synthesis repressor PhaR [Thermaurantiacus sp.]MCS6987532.1 polyhydroxyalkanoate synthesis repressor PhaR [Sphingomonadaceae bacterium]MDW8415133.1 polyhydroxyalkanoate synthesis repressor PhaR [Thermaurantiacus sp.]
MATRRAERNEATEEARPEPVIVKKYANRRLYNTETSSYITLEHLSAMTRAGREFKVIDARSGEDITHAVLTQIILEEETRGATLLPSSVLRQLIAMYGDQMQALVPLYLEASLEAFRRNQEQFRAVFENLLAAGGNPFQALVKQNMSMLEAAAEMWRQANPLLGGTPAPPRKADADEIGKLKAELAELKARLDRLAPD